MEDDAFDFEWPSEDIWNEIERTNASIGLKQIDLTFDKDGVMNYAITGISLTLTNGMKSPVFHGFESTGFQEVTYSMKFDKKTPIRGFDVGLSDTNRIRGVKFLDKEGLQKMACFVKGGDFW